jgi:hypothetical protein
MSVVCVRLSYYPIDSQIVVGSFFLSCRVGAVAVCNLRNAVASCYHINFFSFLFITNRR